MTAAKLIEAIGLEEAQLDEQERIVRNVTLIKAGRSSNKRHYSEELLSGAVKVFEGAKAYANHPEGKSAGRSIRDLTGWYSNVRYENGGLRADRHFLATEAGKDAWAIAEQIISRKAPATLAGLSIHVIGSGKTVKEGDEQILYVDSITRAQSVDDVTDPAAGGGYVLTASGGDELTNALFEAMDYDQWLEARADYVERLKKEWQKVRLEDETKTALAEADQKVKTATAETGRITTAYTEAQSEIQRLSTEIASLKSEVEASRRETVLEKALREAKLPVAYENDLRERLLTISPDQWADIISKEQSKAKHAPAPKVPVTGQGIQESKADVIKPSPLPLPGENYAQWERRVSKLQRN